MTDKTRGFRSIIGATIVDVDAGCVNEVILTDDVGVKHVIEVEVTGLNIPVISLCSRRITQKTIKAAKKMYADWCVEQGVYCNAFPKFESLAEQVQQNWFNMAEHDQVL